MLLGSELLDTNAAIAWMANDGRLPARYRGRDVCVSIVTIGELRFGADKSADRDENHRVVDRLTRSTDVVAIDLEVAAEYGRVKADLRAAGTPIPDNDLWIAATAIRHGLAVVTRDKHFDAVSGLSATPW